MTLHWASEGLSPLDWFWVSMLIAFVIVELENALVVPNRCRTFHYSELLLESEIMTLH